ncbi:hypothetical protein YYC_01298 [Plasmodium yoelii 17X]|uniref:Uncharacterized protein n=1 Tax=Plasmodium yoelii 17X TaxID=1323249 RepID=V7PPN7_PLAYE|nr:hypothetical protein YYC_01298 [Plasmodium yoelii 17X]
MGYHINYVAFIFFGGRYSCKCIWYLNLNYSPILANALKCNDNDNNNDSGHNNNDSNDSGHSSGRSDHS